MDVHESAERDAVTSISRAPTSRRDPGRDPSFAIPHGVVTTGEVSQLQRLAGNAAVAQRLAVQRAPSVADRLGALEKAAQVQKKKSDATQLDLQYRADFGAVIAGYEQIVYRRCRRARLPAAPPRQETARRAALRPAATR